MLYASNAPFISLQVCDHSVLMTAIEKVRSAGRIIPNVCIYVKNGELTQSTEENIGTKLVLFINIEY